MRLEFKIGPSLIFYQKIEIYWQTSQYGAFLCILEALQKRSKGQKQFIIELLVYEKMQYVWKKMLNLLKHFQITLLNISFSIQLRGGTSRARLEFWLEPARAKAGSARSSSKILKGTSARLARARKFWIEIWLGSLELDYLKWLSSARFSSLNSSQNQAKIRLVQARFKLKLNQIFSFNTVEVILKLVQF